jgi:hypothetical protein
MSKRKLNRRANASGIHIGAKQLSEANAPRLSKPNPLDKIVERSKPSGNSAFQIGGQELREVSMRRDRKANDEKSREQIELSKELGDDAAMTVDDFALALEFVRDKFGIVLRSAWNSLSTRPKITARELFALCVSVNDGTHHRDRVLAMSRLTKLGFRVSFTVDGPRPAAALR